MNFDGEFIKIGRADIGALKEKVLQLNSEWRQSTWRQERFRTHTYTQTIELVFDNDFRHENPTQLEMFRHFEDELRPVKEVIENYYRDYSTRLGFADSGYIIRILLVNLLPGGTIREHIDRNFTLAHSHRIHLPVITNENVTFKVGNTTKVMKEGEIWEINNRKMHAVVNKTTTPRVHLIIDWVVPGERCCCGTG